MNSPTGTEGTAVTEVMPSSKSQNQYNTPEIPNNMYYPPQYNCCGKDCIACRKTEIIPSNNKCGSCESYESCKSCGSCGSCETQQPSNKRYKISKVNGTNLLSRFDAVAKDNHTIVAI